MVPNSLDAGTIVDRTFDTYTLENKYLKVTLLPELGGRILSMIYKPTRHEELYQNPLGVPYGIGEGNFYYDWLMVYGGIFPTFPEPEHSKAWLLPWDFKIITQTADEITIAMSITDDVAFKGAPAKFNVGVTGLQATFYVTLKADRAALDTKIVLHNPTDKTVNYEYWLCTTLAPGSDPKDPHTTAGAEIIAPVSTIKMPPWWPDTTKQEQASDKPDVYSFNTLRLFKNWVDRGIAYAYPDMGGANFWGAVNHDNQEGLIRVANNDVTPGMKMWTWGFDSVNIDPFKQPTVEIRPYIEMWAGATTEFFTRTQMAAGKEIVSEETYTPTVGLTNVTQASRDYLANFFVDEAGEANLQLFSVQFGHQLHAVITADGQSISDDPVTFDAAKAVELKAKIPAGAKSMTFTLVDENKTTVLSGEVAVK
ncbi:MAG: DUF5107 domain-containing protein [Anaerolineae bacterium]|nr:DUF5107 domain-containing protein [Anaerolineae bacterium]